MYPVLLFLFLRLCLLPKSVELVIRRWMMLLYNSLPVRVVRLYCSVCALPDDAASVPFGLTHKMDVCRDVTPRPVSHLADAVGQLDFPYNLTLTSSSFSVASVSNV